MPERSLNRRTFMELLGLAAAAACAPSDPCGDHDPERWIAMRDVEGAARGVLGSTPGGWLDVEGAEDRISRFTRSVDHYALRPRMLIGVRDVDLQTQLLDRTLASPILVGPGVLRVPSKSVRQDILTAAEQTRTPIVAYPDALLDPGPRGLVFHAVDWRSWPSGLEAENLLAAGVRSVGDAQQAVAGGARALIVSNVVEASEGGASSLHLLSEIRLAIPDQVELVLDGSFRHGNDILIALGLGAAAVLVGWPIVWGAIATGQNGAKRALQLLELELIRGLRLCGRPELADIAPDLVRRVPELAMAAI